MKILITGARGNFATALIPRLAAAEHSMVLYDLEPMNSPEGSISIQGDIRDSSLLLYAMRGCDAVVHAAAHHSPSMDFRNEQDYFSVNVDGTQNVLRAMLLNEVHALVFSSSDAVYGNGMRDVPIMDEDVPCIPIEIEGITKLLGEELCQFYARAHKFHIAAMRYGCFLPSDWKTSGMGRLSNWLDREDVAQANELALGAVLAEEFSYESFLIHCSKPFVDNDWPTLEEEPERIIEYYYPGAVSILNENNIPIRHIHTRYDITKATTLLGYDPQYNFEHFLERLRNLHFTSH